MNSLLDELRKKPDSELWKLPVGIGIGGEIYTIAQVDANSLPVMPISEMSERDWNRLVLARFSSTVRFSYVGPEGSVRDASQALNEIRGGSTLGRAIELDARRLIRQFLEAVLAEKQT